MSHPRTRSQRRRSRGSGGSDGSLSPSLSSGGTSPGKRKREKSKDKSKGTDADETGGAPIGRRLTRETLLKRGNSTSSFNSPAWIHTRQAQLFFSILILLNTILMGVEADLHDTSAGFSWSSQDDLAWLCVESSFVMAFTVELGLRIQNDGLKTFRDPWNIFDGFLVVAGILDNTLLLFLGLNANVTFMRMLRLCRIGRIVKVLRFFRTLYLLLAGMLNAMRMIVWMVILLFSVIYLCAIIARQLIADGEHAREYFHSVPRAMLSFFQLVTVEGWPDIYKAATDDYPWFGGVIIFFIFFTNMLLLNLIVGVIVENTLEITRNDEEEYMHREKENSAKLGCIESLKEMFDVCDVDEDGTLDRFLLEELLHYLKAGSEEEGDEDDEDGEQASTMRASVAKMLSNLNTQVNFDCTILRWCSATDLMALFDLLSTLDVEGKVKSEEYLKIVQRAMGGTAGILRATDAVNGQLEALRHISDTRAASRARVDEMTSEIENNVGNLVVQLQEVLCNGVKDIEVKAEAAVQVQASKVSADIDAFAMQLRRRRLRGMGPSQFYIGDEDPKPLSVLLAPLQEKAEQLEYVVSSSLKALESRRRK